MNLSTVQAIYLGGKIVRGFRGRGSSPNFYMYPLNIFRLQVIKYSVHWNKSTNCEIFDVFNKNWAIKRMRVRSVEQPLTVNKKTH